MKPTPALALLLTACTGAPAPIASPSRPDIVLVMADDQGLGDMGYTGHPLARTPNFDAAAAAGLRFDRFYAAAPVCSPTRASVLTGRHPNRAGVFQWGHPLRPQVYTLAERLRDAGYRTGHFGKWHLGSVRNGSAAHPGAHGFDTWVSAPNFYDNDPILANRGRAVQLRGESSIVTADLAIDWLREVAPDDAPFLAVVWFGSPHRPHRASAEDRAHYEDLPAKQREMLGEITGMDRAFGRLRAALDELGARDNTILWYCSDNGALPEGSNAGLRGRKGSVWEGGLRVPAFLEWPARLRSPRVTSMRCNTSDICPTVLAAAGVSVDPSTHFDGINLLGLLEPEPREPERSTGGMGFWNHPAPGIGVPSHRLMAELLEAQSRGGDLPPDERSAHAERLPDPPLPSDRFVGHAAWIDGDWKLHRIKEEGKAARYELYDLGSDPAETTDRAAREPARVAALGDRLMRWLRSVVASCNAAG